MKELQEGRGPHQVTLSYHATGRGLVIALTGGDSPHVGAVALSAPRPSLTGEGLGCDTWLIPLPGHKDILVGKELSESLCLALNQPVSVTAGIHMEGATEEDLHEIIRNCRVLGERFLAIAGIGGGAG
jgi:hypothetical protein